MNNKMFYNNNNKKMRELCSNNHAKAPKTVSKPAPNCALIQAHDTATEVIATGAIPFTFTDYMSCTPTIKLVDNVFQITECGAYMINYCVQVAASEETAKIKRAVETARAAADLAIETATAAVLAIPTVVAALSAAAVATQRANAVYSAYFDKEQQTEISRRQTAAFNAATDAASTVGPTNTEAVNVLNYANDTDTAAGIALSAAEMAPEVPAAKTAAENASLAANKATIFSHAISTTSPGMAYYVQLISDAAFSAASAQDTTQANDAYDAASQALDNAIHTYYEIAVPAKNAAVEAAQSAHEAAERAETEAAALLAVEAAAVQLFLYIPNCGQCIDSMTNTNWPNPITSTNWTPIECSRKSITADATPGSISGTYQIEIKNKCALIGLFNVGAGNLALDQDKLPNTCINIFRVRSGCCEAV